MTLAAGVAASGDRLVIPTVAVPKTIAAHARLTTNIGGEDDPRLHLGVMSTVVTADVPIIVERSMYWDSNGVQFSGGTNATGIPLSGVRR